MSSLRLYAIVDARPRHALGRGIDRRPLALVRAAGAWAVVEQASSAAEERRREPPVATLVAYDRVVRRLTRGARAVLPFRFGSSAADAAAVRALLEPLAAGVARALARVRDCVQFTLRVRGEARAPTRSRVPGRPGTKYLEARAAKQRVDEIAPLAAATKLFVRDARVERRDQPSLLAVVYHLVARTDVRKWRLAVARSTTLLDVAVDVGGPFPAYAFTELG